MAMCEMCGADLPAHVKACPACGRTFRVRQTPSPASRPGAHPSLEFAFNEASSDPWKPTNEASHPSLEFVFEGRPASTAKSQPKDFDPFDAGPSTQAGGDSVEILDSIDAPFLGRTIAKRFRIQELIGEGGMGQVYTAHHQQLDRTVCVKVLRPGLQTEPAVLKRFEREARSASRLHHPNSIQVLDFGVDQGAMYLAMEYVAGQTLRDILLSEFPLPEARICHIVAQVLAALAEAHAANVVHRDLKPDNIMVSQLRESPDFVKVLDFGIAKILESDDNLTAADMLCGTPQYMSPEQAGGRTYDGRADLYSIGVILYQLITGDVPFNGRNPLEVLSKSQNQAPMPIHEKRPGANASPQLVSLVMRALSKDPERRPQTAEAFRRELISIKQKALSSSTAAPEQRTTAAFPSAADPTPAGVQQTKQITMMLEDRPPPPPMTQILPLSATATPIHSQKSSLPRVGEAVRFELADAPSRKTRRVTKAPATSQTSSGWLRRVLISLVVVVVVGVGARWLIGDGESSPFLWLTSLFDG